MLYSVYVSYDNKKKINEMEQDVPKSKFHELKYLFGRLEIKMPTNSH